MNKLILTLSIAYMMDPRGPKLPYSKDGKDDMDAFLQRFERYAEVVVWAEKHWSLHLRALLRGKAD